MVLYCLSLAGLFLFVYLFVFNGTPAWPYSGLSFLITFTVPEGRRWGPCVSTQHKGEPVVEVFTGQHTPERWIITFVRFGVGLNFLFCVKLLKCWLYSKYLLVTWLNVSLVYLGSPLLFPSYPQKSLHFVKRMMENVIEDCLQKPAVSFVHCRFLQSFKI